MSQKICPRCGQPAYLNAPTCAQCGHLFRTNFAQQPTQVFHPRPIKTDDIQMCPGTHSVIAAAVLSLFLTGGGQIYNRQYVKGVVLLVITIALAFGTCGAFVCIAWPVLLIDAILIASRLNRGEIVRQWQFF